MTSVMDRRAFIAVIGGGLVTLPLAAQAQQAGKVYRIGMLLAAAPTDENEVRNLDGLRDGLRAFGYSEGRNLMIEYRWAEGRLERLNLLASELVTRKPDVVVAVSEPAAIAARRATTTIPIVMPICGDPVAAGLAASLSRPGGNVTGLSQLKPEIAPKYLELLRETQPKLTRAGLVFDDTRASDKVALRELQQASNATGIDLYLADVRTRDRYAPALETLVKNRIEGLIVLASAATYTHRHLVVGFALRHRVAMISGLSEFAEAGALMTYGPNQPDMFRRAASYIVKILKGASPAELPIEQPTKFELIINLKTAKALGLTIPQSLLLRADRVIE
jgi:putative ABC transport system substrate-binding protein